MTEKHPLAALLQGLDLDVKKLDEDGHLSADLTRRAWNEEHGAFGAEHHESLEWLGDRILGAVVAQELWTRFPHADPGRMDLARDALTSAEALADVARGLDFLALIRMGTGERAQQQVAGDKALSDHLEAVIGAVFLSAGWPGASRFVSALLAARIPTALPSADRRAEGSRGSEAMTALSALVQRLFKTSIAKNHWQVERVGGPDNAPIHVVSVTLPDGSVHTGEPVSGKKAAAKASAAVEALVYLREERPNL